ncbi:MAG: hypothetical protein ACI9DC_000884 [Gammaproteobacteria bacterium]|jgi:hypothetical protein
MLCCIRLTHNAASENAATAEWRVYFDRCPKEEVAMNRDNNRMMLELERMRRSINRDTIAAQVGDLTLAELEPVLKMVADVRAAYIKSVFDLATQCDGIPSAEQIVTLREHRMAFTELIDVANAIETAISRGYVGAESAATD